MNDEQQVDAFLENYQRVIDYFDKDKIDKVETSRALKRYSWLMIPRTKSLPITRAKAFKGGKPNDLSFYVINESDRSTPNQILHVNLVMKIFSFLNKKEKVLRAVAMDTICTYSKNFFDPRKLTIHLDSKKEIVLVFPDVKNRLLFESAFNHMQKKRYREIFSGPQCSLSVFTTTWNVGFSEPPQDPAEIWLKNFSSHHIIALGLQECKSSSWLERLQILFTSNGFSCLGIITMWRVSPL